jgi:hypothetical protein
MITSFIIHNLGWQARKRLRFLGFLFEMATISLKWFAAQWHSRTLARLSFLIRENRSDEASWAVWALYGHVKGKHS